MRHSLPHARRIGRRMLLLLLPLRAFGHGRTGKLVDRAIVAGALEDPIAAGGDNARHPAIDPGKIFPVPSGPLLLPPPGGGQWGELDQPPPPPHPPVLYFFV